jgi:hypothetical protein
MPTDETVGLCETCNSRASCTARKGFRRPVLCCEEFDDAPAMPPRTVGSKATEEAYEAKHGRQAGADTILGLCCNCENRHGCTLTVLPGGVWHCQEYR